MATQRTYEGFDQWKCFEFAMVSSAFGLIFKWGKKNLNGLYKWLDGLNETS